MSRILKPIKTNGRPEWQLCKDGSRCLEISNWHWRKVFEKHHPLMDWEAEELKMTPEEASAEIRKWDRQKENS